MIQRDFGCVLGVQQIKQFQTLPKLIWCGSWGYNLGHSLRNQVPHVFYGQKIQRPSRPGKQFKLGIDEEILDVPRVVVHYPVEIWLWPSPEASSLHVVSRLESDHRGVSDKCVTRQLGQLHSILPPTSFFHRTIGGGDVRGSASRVDQAMDVMRTYHSAVKGAESYVQTLYDALQTQWAVLRFVISRCHAHNLPVLTLSGALRWIRSTT
ncbi:hypothetical protein TNCV_5082761 [Trichonephila clavipes]|nr:hypothetical protein TNCV_5082761 [Trichonephila clavipes]